MNRARVSHQPTEMQQGDLSAAGPPSYESFAGMSLAPLPVLWEDEEEEAGEVGTGVAEPPSRLWMPDALSSSCSHCDEPFSFLRRRHHCRVCGRVFCHGCSAHYIDGELVGAEGSVRSCRRCLLQIQEQLDMERTTILKALATEDARSINGYGTLHSNGGIEPEISDAKRKEMLETK